MGSFKDESTNCCGRFNKRQFHDLLLVVVVANIMIGLVYLYKYMGPDDRWTVDPKQREKVLGFAVFLLLSTCALCWFIMRKEQQKWESERRCLIIDRPPSYESCISGEHSPPPYLTVVHIV